MRRFARLISAGMDLDRRIDTKGSASLYKSSSCSSEAVRPLLVETGVSLVATASYALLCFGIFCAFRRCMVLVEIVNVPLYTFLLQISNQSSNHPTYPYRPLAASSLDGPFSRNTPPFSFSLPRYVTFLCLFTFHFSVSNHHGSINPILRRVY